MAAIDIVLQKVGRPWSLPKRQKKEGDGWHDRCSTRGWKFTFSKTRCAGQERRPGVVRPRWGAYEMLKGAVVGGGGGVSELGLLSKAWGGQNENLFANSKTRRCVEESKSSGLRRQRAVPKHNVGRNALCQGDRWVVATNAGERRKVHRRSAERQFAFAEVDIGVPRELWEKFKEMPPLFYTKTRRRRGSAAAYERLLGAQHTQAHARPKKAGWRPLSTKNPDVLAAA